MATRYTGIIDHYAARLPVTDATPRVSLAEGQTPLIQLQNIPAALNLDADIYVKFEGLNPTASFKDRGMNFAVSKAAEEGSKAIICASTGNTSAAAAAYAARANMKAFVLIPDGKIAMGKLAQAMMHGAVVIQIKGNFDDGMRLVKEVASHAPVTIVNSINPYRLQGQKTAAFEICDELGRAPDYHFLPVGNAGNISAHWIGYTEYAGLSEEPCVAQEFAAGMEYDRSKVTDNRPVMVGYQAEGAAPFVTGEMVDDPETVATAIRIGHPQSYDIARRVEQESGGWFSSLPDYKILEVQKLLAECEGVFCEPASAASLAGAITDIQAGKIPAGSQIVCTLTGHGLKDPDTAIKQSTAAVLTVDANLESVSKALLDNL